MFRRHSSLFATLLALAFMFALVVVGCSDDGDDDNIGGPNGNGEPPEITAAMEGIWSYSTTGRDCDTHEIIDDLTDTGIDTLCAGDPMHEEEDDIFTDCDVTIIDGDSFRVDCDVSETVFDCTVHYTYTMTVNYTNTAITMTGRMQSSYSGAGCGGIEDECFDINSTATRTGAAPAGACEGKTSRPAVVRHLMPVMSPRH